MSLSKPGKLLQPHQVATEFGVDAKTLHRWTKQGMIPAERTAGGHHRYRPEDVKAFKESMAAQGSVVDVTFNRYRHRFMDGVWGLWCLRCRTLIVVAKDADLSQDDLTLGDVCRAAVGHERDSHG